jgi:uncharacterized protein DUF2630
MADEQIHNRIEALVEEEQQLYERASHEDGLTSGDRERLDHIRIALDQAWDLLRQRRALREHGLDPGEAHVRDEQVVENYEQ